MIGITPMRWWHIEPAMTWERQLFGSTAWSAAQMWSELARDSRRYYVIASDGQDDDGAHHGAIGRIGPDGERVLGYAGINLLPPDADVQTVAVAPHLQGRGWARRLLERLLADAEEAGCTQVMLEVRADNVSALGLYERFGFEVIARRTSYYGPGEDALIMRLRPIRTVPTAAVSGS